MLPRPLSGQHYRFGAFEYDPQTGELRKRGLKIRIKPQAVRVFNVLLGNPGATVTPEEFRNRLWPSDTFVDFEHRLHDAVSQLREALSDSAEKPRYIETLSRRGYRFIRELEPVPILPVLPPNPGESKNGSIPPSKEPANPPELPVQPPKILDSAGPISRTIRLIIVIPAVLILGSLALLLRTEPNRAAPYSAVPLVPLLGSQDCPSFAPDGERVAFSWDGEKQNNFDIYVKQSGSDTPLQLTSDPRPDLSPTWSPDGRAIAFVRVSSDRTAEVLMTPSLGGGTERRVAEVQASVDARRDRFLSWSPDARWLVFSDASSIHARFGLYLLSVQTGEKRCLTSPPIGYDDFDPAFSPDMKHLAFARHSGPSVGDLFLLELTPELNPRGKPQRLTFDNNLIRSPVWTRDGGALLFTRYNMMTGRQRLWRVELSNPRKLEPVPIAADNASQLALSPRGDQLIYARETNTSSNIWGVELLDTESAKVARAGPQLFLSSSTGSSNPKFSPDGQHIAFQTGRSGWSEIWVADRDGSHPHQLTDLRGTVAGFPDWSPDGKKIVFHLRRQSTATVFVVDVRTGRASPLSYDAVDDTMPSWSHDAKWIYFASPRTGDWQVWKIAVNGGRPIQVTTKGGMHPLESPDGKFLFYTRFHYQLWRIPLPGGNEQQVLGEAMGGDFAPYAVTRKGIYFVQGDGRTLRLFNFEGHRCTTLTQTPGPVGIGLAVSPDDQLLLYNQEQPAVSQT